MLDKQTKLAILNEKLLMQQQLIYSEETDLEIEGKCGGNATLILSLKASINKRREAEKFIEQKIEGLEGEKL